MIEDFDLIVSSFQTQYGIRLSQELSSMKWDEFYDLVAGLNEKTPLGRIVAVRAETNQDVIKNFTPHEHKIRNDWRRRAAKQVTQEQLMTALDDMKNALIGLAGKKDAEN